jgi:hypothetical protein
MEIINYIQSHWLEWLFAIITSLLAYKCRSLSKKLKQRQTEQEALKSGVVALLHDRLYQGCRYHISQGIITEDELKNMEYLYNGYHALGGNGTGTELYQRVKKLPLKVD